MTTVTFDTLKFANTLKAAGVDARQAEAEAFALSEILEVNMEKLATKSDLELLRAAMRSDMESLKIATKHDIESLRSDTKADIESLKTDIESLRSDTKADIASLKASTRTDLAQLELRMTLKFGAMLAAAVGVLIAVLRVHS
jgi:hypothetical protein